MNHIVRKLGISQSLVVLDKGVHDFWLAAQREKNHGAFARGLAIPFWKIGNLFHLSSRDSGRLGRTICVLNHVGDATHMRT